MLRPAVGQSGEVPSWRPACKRRAAVRSSLSRIIVAEALSHDSAVDGVRPPAQGRSAAGGLADVALAAVASAAGRPTRSPPSPRARSKGRRTLARPLGRAVRPPAPFTYQRGPHSKRARRDLRRTLFQWAFGAQQVCNRLLGPIRRASRLQQRRALVPRRRKRPSRRVLRMSLRTRRSREVA